MSFSGKRPDLLLLYLNSPCLKVKHVTNKKLAKTGPLALTLSIPPNMSKVMVFRYYWIGILCMLLGQVQILS